MVRKAILVHSIVNGESVRMTFLLLLQSAGYNARAFDTSHWR